MEGVMAVVTCFAADFAPKNWALCNGQILPIAQNQALFSLLGTTYGGNGVNTFGLPDLRGRRPVSPGQGSGLSNYVLGQTAGSETTTLNVNNLPAHNHNGNLSLKIEAYGPDGSQPDPSINYAAGMANAYIAPASATGQMAAPVYTATIGPAGNSQPFQVLMPYLVVNYIICLYGIFPSRN